MKLVIENVTVNQCAGTHYAEYFLTLVRFLLYYIINFDQKYKVLESQRIHPCKRTFLFG